MDRKERIFRWVDEHREELLEDLKTLCRIPSVKGEPEEDAPYGPGPAAALTKAMELCEGYGLSVKNHGCRVMTADLGSPEGRELDILAHLDVVPAGDGWDSDPFEPVLKDDGCLYGRGVADDKGGAVTALYALRCVKELGLPVRRGCRLILGTDEENGSSDIAYYYKKEKPAPNTFTPDSEFPVGNAEKGFYRLRFRKSWEPETAVPRVTELAGGSATNAVPTEAWAVIAGMEPQHLMAGAAPLCAELGAACRVDEEEGGARLTVVGRGCHAAAPGLGNNANTILVRVLTELPLADCASTRALKEIDTLLPHGDFLGRALGIAQSDEITKDLTCSFTVIRFHPTEMEGLCDCRIPLCADQANCKDVADARLRALGFTSEGAMIPPHHTSADTPFIRTLLRCYEAFTGLPGECYSMGGGTYVHDVPGGVAFGYGMPGADPRMHGANERAPVEDLFTAAKIFAAAVAELCE